MTSTGRVEGVGDLDNATTEPTELIVFIDEPAVLGMLFDAAGNPLFSLVDRRPVPVGFRGTSPTSDPKETP